VARGRRANSRPWRASTCGTAGARANASLSEFICSTTRTLRATPTIQAQFDTSATNVGYVLGALYL
jgi:hypothetical protein